MISDFLQPLPYAQLKPIPYDMAKELVNTEIELEVLLLAIYNQVTQKGLPISMFANKEFFNKNRKPIGEFKKGKVSIICPFHETENDDSTSVLKGKRKQAGMDGRPDLIKCFTGGCTATKAIVPVYAYMILVLGVDPKIIGTPVAKSEYGKAIYGLAKFLGYRVVQNGRRRITKEEQRRNAIQDVLNDATEIYHQEFMNNENAKKYFLDTRGFQYAVKDPMELATKLKLGWAPASFPSNFLFEKLEAKHKTEDMIEASVVKWVEFKDLGGKIVEAKPLDFHSGEALIAPYWSRTKVYKHYSRAINADKKWRHMRAAGTSDEPLNFHEGTRYEKVNVIEGELSWLSMIALDYENSLATYGTNGLSSEHVQMLIKKREESNGAFCKTIYVIYDGDTPGREATVKTGKLLVESGFDVRVVMLPDGMDPNDMLVKHKEKAKSILDKLYVDAVSYYTFLALNSISKDSSSTSERLVEMSSIKEMISSHGIVDSVQLYLIAKEFAGIANMPVEIVWEGLKPKENKNIEVFTIENFVFLTKDMEGYYLTKLALKGKAAYVEDVSLTFVDISKMTVKSIVVDEKFYDEQEREIIKSFCDKQKVKFLSFYDFKSICEVSINSQTLIDSLLKN